MRVENFNPNRFDQTFEDVCIERLVEAAEVVADEARRKCPVGTVSRPIYKTGPYAGKEWTARDAGQLKRSIRVTRRTTKTGKPLSRIRNVRTYAGTKKAYYASIVEHGGRPFMRPAFTQSFQRVKEILGVR